MWQHFIVQARSLIQEGEVEACEDLCEKKDEMLSRVLRAGLQVAGQDRYVVVEAMQSEVAELQEANATLESQLVTANDELSSVRTKNEQLEAARIEQERRSILASVMSDEEFDEHKDVIMAMDDGAVQLMAERAALTKKEEPPASPTTLTAGQESDDEPTTYVLG